jgi:hypothetical protein
MEALAWVFFIAVVAAIVIGGLSGLRRVVEGGRKCPHCRSHVPRRAMVCAHCTRTL